MYAGKLERRKKKESRRSAEDKLGKARIGWQKGRTKTRR
jgi:hypothetical protein